MDGKDPFMIGFEKEAFKAPAFLRAAFKPRVASRARNIQRIGDKRKFKEALFKSPVKTLTEVGNRPSTQAKKFLGYGMLAGGAGAYGVHQLSKPQRTEMQRGYYGQR